MRSKQNQLITHLNTHEIIFLKACESHFYTLRIVPGVLLLHFKGVSEEGPRSRNFNPLLDYD